MSRAQEPLDLSSANDWLLDFVIRQEATKKQFEIKPHELVGIKAHSLLLG